jgi:TadE-like protein
MRHRMARRGGRRRLDRAEHGAVALEFALLAPLLFALLFGIITAGLGYNNVLGVADGVHEGARFGATTLSSPSWATTVQQQTIDLTYLNVSGRSVVTTEMVCAQLVKAPTPVWTSSCDPLLLAKPPEDPAGVAAGTCLVKVWAQIPVTLTFVLIPTQTIQVHRQSVTLYERGTC